MRFLGEAALSLILHGNDEMERLMIEKLVQRMIILSFLQKYVLDQQKRKPKKLSILWSELKKQIPSISYTRNHLGLMNAVRSAKWIQLGMQKEDGSLKV